MSNTTAPTPDIDAAINTVNTLVDTLSMKLFNLGQITKLAAFAADARRTLELYSCQSVYFPEFKESIENCDESTNSWKCFEDSSGDVLQEVARQIDACTAELNNGTQCVRELRSERMKGRNHD